MNSVHLLVVCVYCFSDAVKQEEGPDVGMKFGMGFVHSLYMLFVRSLHVKL